MKLAAIYNVWDSEELLDKSIAQIYDHVDRVILVWQTHSNFGEFNPDVATTVQVLATKYPKVSYIFYQPNIALGGTENEKNKRRIGLEAAKDCTHFLFMDCDEFYDSNEFAQAKQEFIDKGLDTSYVGLHTYFMRPTYRLTPDEAYYVPFICTTDVLKVGGKFPAYVDPTRGVSPAGKCEELSIKMHHMSYVRKDIGRKLRNSSASVNWDAKAKEIEICNWQLGQPIPMFEQHKIKKVPNQFGI